MERNTIELIIFLIYLACMLGVGIYFFIKTRSGGDKDYFLGGRQMGPWVTALSAGASDMSAWVLMGLPTAIYAAGLGQVWIPVGLAIGYTISWLTMAPRLRKFSIVANDSITIPQYLSNRFLAKSKALQIICAVIFLVAYTIYASSSVLACGTLFHTVVGIDAEVAMYVAALVIVGYVFLGGFKAVCWTDFFQGMLVLAAMMIAPIFALFALNSVTTAPVDPGYWQPLTSWQDVLSGLAWGLGYFGMPHIIVRFMSLRSQKEMRKSAKIGITWTVLIVIFAALIGIVGRMFLGYDSAIEADSLVFIVMVRSLFPAVISGILLAAVLSASMSTADSQLLAAASAFSADVYKPVIRKNKASEKEMLWLSRFVVLAIAFVAVLIASNPNSGSIMSLVSNAWGIFGAAFGPAILLSLFWKRFNFAGAVAGIVTGAVVDIAWLTFLSSTGLYELLPGFLAGLAVAVAVTLATKEPSQEVEDLFDRASAYED
ncbi:MULTISPECIES: sodium/proline symporter [unclassified Adlercreutzia]|uniref:sodium/proline symporter n=1 Tax=unclassified Adlercreutzia TaxID=2636013 RepID=UPI0013EC1E9D|nr:MULTISPECIES: sodium/proline symporter [unclassified Adlercreutzia]